MARRVPVQQEGNSTPAPPAATEAQEQSALRPMRRPRRLKNDPGLGIEKKLTGVRLDPRLWERVREAAALNGLLIERLVTDALERELERLAQGDQGNLTDLEWRIAATETTVQLHHALLQQVSRRLGLPFPAELAPLADGLAATGTEGR